MRFIGEAGKRIAEDYLRILRFFRMHAAFGAGELDATGYLACIGGRAGLATLSAERVRMEMLKLLVADGAAPVQSTRWPTAACCRRSSAASTYGGPFAAMIAAERALGLKADAMRRLAALAVAVTEDAKRIATRLRLSNAEAKALDSMGHRWWRLAGMDEARARRRMYRLGAEAYRDRLLLAWARTGGDSDTLERAGAPAGALDRAEIPAEGCRLHRARRRRRARTRPCADTGGRRLARRGFSDHAPALSDIADQAVARLKGDARS